MSENIDLYVYKEFNAKVCTDVDKNGYFGSLKMDDEVDDPKILDDLHIGPNTKLYTFTSV